MRRHALVALLLLPMLALGACGGGGSGGDGTEKAAGDGEKMREYAKCMRANGADMPDPSADGRVEVKVSGGKAGEEKMKAAERKCRRLMPNGGEPRRPDAKQLAEMRAMSKCMRENGVPDFPDPDPETGGIQIRGRKGGGGIDPQSTAFKKADKICNKNGGGRLDSKRDDGGGPGLSGGSGE
ncbi:hypothetical protein [Actinomadura sp. 21ATH]|uniref:hypothetical protein n=1 Tax=Actinomadura sp. 21ATH TaxID=1735444 RepID=UPI0035BF742B